MSDERLLVIIGPSGAGKSSVVRVLQDRRLIHLTPSWTTRSPRVDELNGTIEHVFVSNKEFTNKVSEDFFLEEVELFGLPYRYGLPKISNPTHQGEEIPTIMLRAPLLPLLSRHYKNYVIYQLEDAYDRVLGRLNEREKMGEQQGLRLKEYDKEVAVGHQLADRVFINNKTIDELVERVADAIEIDFRKT